MIVLAGADSSGNRKRGVEMELRVIAVKEERFGDRIKLIADSNVECFIDSLMGMRRFHLNQGSTVTFKFSKSEMIQVGDKVSFELCARKDFARWFGNQIRWHWC